MTVQRVEGGGPAQGPRKTERPSGAGAAPPEGFAGALREAMKAPAPAPVKGCEAPWGSCPHLPPPERGALDALDGALRRAEGAGKALGDSEGTPLRKVEGAILGLSETAEDLAGAASRLPADHPLRRMAEEFRILAFMEGVKWRRGDSA